MHCREGTVSRAQSVGYTWRIPRNSSQTPRIESNADEYRKQTSVDRSP